MQKIIYVLLVVSLLSSCTKEAGFGGLSTVSGKVYAKDITPANEIEAEGYTADMDVIITVTGSGKILKEVKTDLTGSYKFEELRKGNYTIYTFSDCDKCTNNDSTVIQTIEIEERKGDYVLPDFNIEI